MRQANKKIVAGTILLALSIGSSLLMGADNKKKHSGATSPPQMDEGKRALHALNRLTFGLRPGDVERVRTMGVDKWIELQLHPEKIDDSALQARLAPLRTLKMSTQEVVENFPPPQVIKAIADGKQSLPSDPAKRAIYEDAQVQYQNRKERKDIPRGGQQNPVQMADEPQSRQKNEARMYADLQAEQILDLPAEQRYATIMKMPPDERHAMARSLNGGQREQMLDDFNPRQRETVMAMANPQQVVATEAQEGKILRAAYSERQLEEVMTDFWFNHFNIFINKGADRYMITSYERDVIRPHVLGKFKDLLMATAKSPAMLFYLDNWQSVGPDSDVALGHPQNNNRNRAFNRPAPGSYVDRYGRVHGRFGGANFPPRNPQNGNAKQAKNKQRNGLNENYAREIMELHTLGVDGGYTQKDVTELAKILTGWTIKQPKQGGGFDFNERMHQPGTKIFLGRKIKEDGEKEGAKVLETLAHHPSTAKFISRELAMRFVSDNPSPALVERMAQTFLKKDGDIREVLRTMFKSPEFWAADAYRAKVKTPFEFVVSAIRATAVDVSNAMPLMQALNRMGEPLYGMQPPTGYSMKADAWVNSSALLNRMNFALALGAGKMNGVQFDGQRLFNNAPPPMDSSGALAGLENALLAGEVSPQTHAVLEKQLSDPQVSQRRLDDAPRPPNLGVIAGLILGSPEFQKR